MSNGDYPTFRSLGVGQRFRFFAGGSPLTKTGKRTYSAPQWSQPGLMAHDPDQSVIPEAPVERPIEGTDSPPERQSAMTKENPASPKEPTAREPAGASERDAARYRWLRNFAFEPDWMSYWEKEPEALDAAIDAAIEPESAKP